MTRKMLILALLLVGLILPTANAQEVTVDGMGRDRDSAVRDAARNAVMQVVGTFIDSRTLVESAVVELDEIYAQSQGFVNSIKVLEEGAAGADYRVRARIDVNTNPDAKLVDKLTMLMMLNDPRIAVVVLSGGGMYEEDGTSVNGHDIVSEAALNNRLLELGFRHVVDADHIIKLRDAHLLNSVYNGQQGFAGDGSDHSVDYLVLGKSKLDSYRITLPNQMGGGVMESPLQTTKADLTVKVLKFDTGDIVGTFTVDGQGIDNNAPRAGDKALRAAAEKAAVQLEDRFKKFSASSTQGLQIKVFADSYGKVEELIQELRGLPDVQNVYVREQGGGRAVLEVDSVQKPHILVRLLRERTKLGLFVESISNSTIELSVS